MSTGATDSSHLRAKGVQSFGVGSVGTDADRECAHGNEPGCAVQAAIEDERLDEARFRHFLKLRDELDAAAASLAQRRIEASAASKALGKRALGKQAKDKYGRR